MIFILIIPICSKKKSGPGYQAAFENEKQGLLYSPHEKANYLCRDNMCSDKENSLQGIDDIYYCIRREQAA